MLEFIINLILVVCLVVYFYTSSKLYKLTEERFNLFEQFVKEQNDFDKDVKNACDSLGNMLKSLFAQIEALKNELEKTKRELVAASDEIEKLKAKKPRAKADKKAE